MPFCVSFSAGSRGLTRQNTRMLPWVKEGRQPLTPISGAVLSTGCVFPRLPNLELLHQVVQVAALHLQQVLLLFFLLQALLLVQVLGSELRQLHLVKLLLLPQLPGLRFAPQPQLRR